MSKIIQKSLLFIVAAGLIHLGVSCILGLRFSSLEDLADLLKGKADIIYLGDSVLLQADADDRNKAAISDYLGELLPECRIKLIAGRAFHPGVYEAICSYILASGERPRTIIIPINLRSFSPSWDKRHIYQLNDEIRLLSNPCLYHFWFKPLEIFKARLDASRDELESSNVFDDRRLIGTVASILKEMNDHPADAPDSLKRKSIAFLYLYRLDDSHRKVRSLINIVSMLHKSGVQSILYVTPLDYRLCASYYGDDFRPRVEKNIEVIKSSLKSQDIAVLDLAFSLESEFFSHSYYPNEHLKESGRRLVAEKLAEVIHKK